ncbi:MAG: asparagine synthetase B [Candidatus Eisenbacteria bacterium]|nr:asparagine synthetase B [Candidatus Eisenbacteria bacterium]
MLICAACALALAAGAAQARLLVPMDLTQTDHLKSYGVAYHALEQGQNVEWLLNYRGGSFLLEDTPENRRYAVLEGVRSEVTDGGAEAQIYAQIEAENMEVILLEKAPRVAVYVPPLAEPWDDAVMLALDYAAIPYDRIYDREVHAGRLGEYDWLHLHHEDFTGQYGKFYAGFRHADWYRQRQELLEGRAREAGYAKVWQHKHATAERIRDYVARGGFLFAMCSGTDTFDIALAAGEADIVDRVYDGDPASPRAQQQLDFSHSLAFENFTLEMNPFVYEHSNIDMSDYSRLRGPEADYFVLFEFSAKEDPVPTMLTQCHVNMIDGFMGQTTSYNRETLKPSTLILAEVPGTDEVKYVHGNLGKGTFTFYGGHDPEDYEHRVGDPPTRLELHKNSPGYRLILNNVLFPAAQKQERKT